MFKILNAGRKGIEYPQIFHFKVDFFIDAKFTFLLKWVKGSNFCSYCAEYLASVSSPSPAAAPLLEPE